MRLRLPKPYAARLCASLLLLTPAACAWNSEPPAQPSAVGAILLAAAQGTIRSDADPVGGSPYGSYLAGLFAGHERDLSAAAGFMLHALAHDPADVQLLSRALLLLAGEGRFDEAVEIARRLDTADPGNGIAVLVLAVDAVGRGALDEAEALLARMPERGVSGISGPLLQAWVGVARGDPAVALGHMAPLRDKSGFGVLYDLHLGMMFDVLGRPAEAGTQIEKALTSAGQPSLRLTWLAGNFYERSGQRDRAIQIYKSFLEISPDSVVITRALERAEAGRAVLPVVADAEQGMAEALFNLASLLSQERAQEIALVHAHLALRLAPEFLIVKILLGEILQAQGRSEAAIAVYRQFAEDSSFAWMVRMRIAEEYERLDRVEAAVAELDALAGVASERAEPLIRLGNLLRNRERYAEAVEAYDRAIERIGEPERRHWTLFYFRGIALERESQWGRAEKDFLLALELEPEQPFVMNYLAYSWVEQKLNLDKAKGMLVRAVELRPDDGFIVDSLGWVYYRLGEYKKGVRYLERAVELRPQDSVINDHLGDAYWRVGRRAEARFQWRRALSLEPEPDELPKIEQKIERGLVDEPKNI